MGPAPWGSWLSALGLLVDVPVVAGDGIKRGLADGLPRAIAAWLGPTKLATVIFFATLTNVIAYLPFLMLTGNTGEFLRSLPIVMTAALLCALVVAMTFIPLLGYFIQRPPKRKELTDRRTLGFAPEATILSRRRPVLVLPRHLAAERCALDRDK
jgi:multidrug efflux pump subunit AcrB